MYAVKQYAFSFHRFFLAVPFSCSSRRLRLSRRYTSPNSAKLRLAPLYTLHFASQTRSEQGRGEQSLLIGVYRSSAEYIGGSGESCQYRAKNQLATTKGTQKKERGDLIIGGQNFQRASIAMLLK